MRARQVTVSLGFLAVFLGVLLFWPVMLTYTFVYGEKGTATVTRCEVIHKTKMTTTKCRGTWRTENGRTGSGSLYGLDADQQGETVPIRIGPMGPYAGGFRRSWTLFLTAVPVVLAPIIAVAVLVPMLGRSRKLAKSLLADPGDGSLLLVSRRKVTRPDGSPYATARTLKSPPAGYQRIDLPGRPALQNERSVIDAAAGYNQDRTEFTALDGPGGEPLMVLEYRGSSTSEPEDVVLDPAGTPRAVVRRLSPHPPRFTLLDAGGERIGSAKPATGKMGTTLLVRDAGGVPVATAAMMGFRWVVRIERRASPLMRDTVIALLIAQFRTG